MPIPQTLNVHRHDGTDRVLVTLAGEIDLESAPLIRESLGHCLREGIRTIHVDLTAVTFCDCRGINAFLAASQQAAAAGGTLRLLHPPAMLVRLLALTGTGSLLLGPPDAPGFSVPDEPVGSVRAVRPSCSGEMVPWPAPAVSGAPGGEAVTAPARAGATGHT